MSSRLLARRRLARFSAVNEMSLRDLRKVFVTSLKRARHLLSSASPPKLTMDDVLRNTGARSIVEQFHLVWYDCASSSTMTWMGHPILKNPMDLWLYQEILCARRPRLLIETGTHHGGSALYFSMIARMADFPLDIVTIDFNPKLAYDPAAYCIHSVRAISTTRFALDQVKKIRDALARELGDDPQTMVVLDSDHSMQNVLDELTAYSPFVTPGDYLVVEDTNVNGHPVLPRHGPGPFEAVRRFLSEHREFQSDAIGEKFLLTQNPGGWLRRIH